MEQTDRNAFANAAKSTTAALLLVLVTAAIYFYLTSPGDLAPPPAQPAPSPEHLGSVTALTNTAQPPFAQWDVSVHWKDIDSFHQHLAAAATQQGWFAYKQHRESPGSAAVIIMPADELPMLAALEADPVAWATARSTPPVNPKPPSNLNLVKAGLNINPGSHLIFTVSVVAAAIFTMATILFLFLAVNHCERAWGQCRAKPEPN